MPEENSKKTKNTSATKKNDSKKKSEQYENPINLTEDLAKIAMDSEITKSGIIIVTDKNGVNHKTEWGWE